MAFYSRKDLIPGKPFSSEEPEPNKKSELSPCHAYPAKHVIPTALVFSLGIAGAAFLMISYLALRRCASQRRSSPPPRTYSNREEFADGLEGPEIDHPAWYIRTIGLPQGVIESIPRFSYKKGEGLIETTSDCSVCLSEFEDGESLRLLPKCSHAFHVACIDTWLGSHTNCPLCRSPVQPGLVEPSLTSDGGGNVGIEIPEVGNGAMTLTLTGQEMEGVRRSVSLDLSSALDIHVEANKAFGAKRSISISGPSVLV